MKMLHSLALLTGIFAASATAFAEDSAPKSTDNYPLTTCVVSGEKLGEMDKPYIYKYEGREVRFCCKHCLKDFNKDPQKYMKKLDEAEKKAAKK